MTEYKDQKVEVALTCIGCGIWSDRVRSEDVDRVSAEHAQDCPAPDIEVEECGSDDE